MNTNEYIDRFVVVDHPQLAEIQRQYAHRRDVKPHIGPHVGKMLGLLVRTIKAKSVIEFGSCIGYSAIWIGEALRETGGRLISIEFDKDLFEAAKTNVGAAGLSSIVDVVHGDAAKLIDSFPGPFDLILQDSDKTLYPTMLEKCVERLRPGGILAADDALFVPMGIGPELSKPIDEYNRRVFAHPALYSTILPIGDGLALSIKR